MIEAGSFIIGILFSLIVQILSINKTPLPPARKALYSVLSFIGITGMLWLSGVLIAHFLRKLQILA